MFRSVVTLAKVTLIFLNIWVLAVVLVVSLGHWRVFEASGPAVNYGNSHLLVMRELKEEGSVLAPALNDSAFQQPNVEILVPAPQKSPQSPSAIATGSPNQPAVASRPVGSWRTENLQRWCSQHHPSHLKNEEIPASKLTSIMVDQRHKLLFCSIPGVALNDWRKILLILSGAVNTTSITSISGGDVFGKYGKSVKRLSDFSAKERADMLNTYYKSVLVRDPLERLVSAYTGKFMSKWSTYFHTAFGSQIIKRYRRDATPEAVKSGSDVKFFEFAQYVIDAEHESTGTLNEHWQQYYKLCHPCMVHYDFVGTYENVLTDTKTILDSIGAKTVLKPPFVTETKRLTEKEMIALYKSLNAKDLNNLFKVYSPDYTLFGYECPHFLHELMKKENHFHDY